jgi:hypothetical protein
MQENKDWFGNSKTVFTTLGASSHSKDERERNDYYATDPKAVEMLLELETFNKKILEPCCGQGHISETLIKNGYEVDSYDLIDRNYGKVADFFGLDSIKSFNGDIITNPPYSACEEFIEKSLNIISSGNKIAYFMTLTFVEGKKRKEFLKKYPIHTIYVSSSRLNCPKNGEFTVKASSARCYAWFIWVKDYNGPTNFKWFN